MRRIQVSFEELVKSTVGHDASSQDHDRSDFINTPLNPDIS